MQRSAIALQLQPETKGHQRASAQNFQRWSHTFYKLNILPLLTLSLLVSNNFETFLIIEYFLLNYLLCNINSVYLGILIYCLHIEFAIATQQNKNCNRCCVIMIKEVKRVLDSYFDKYFVHLMRRALGTCLSCELVLWNFHIHFVLRLRLGDVTFETPAASTVGR